MWCGQVIAATNRIDILDPALLRSGRLDRKIEFPLPNEDARAKVLEISARKMNVSDKVNYEELARTTDEFNCAQLKAVAVEAGMIALREGASIIAHEHFITWVFLRFSFPFWSTFADLFISVASRRSRIRSKTAISISPKAATIISGGSQCNSWGYDSWPVETGVAEGWAADEPDDPLLFLWHFITKCQAVLMLSSPGTA